MIDHLIKDSLIDLTDDLGAVFRRADRTKERLSGERGDEFTITSTAKHRRTGYGEEIQFVNAESPDLRSANAQALDQLTELSTGVPMQTTPVRDLIRAISRLPLDNATIIMGSIFHGELLIDLYSQGFLAVPEIIDIRTAGQYRSLMYGEALVYPGSDIKLYVDKDNATITPTDNEKVFNVSVNVQWQYVPSTNPIYIQSFDGLTEGKTL